MSESQYLLLPTVTHTHTHVMAPTTYSNPSFRVLPSGRCHQWRKPWHEQIWGIKICLCCFPVAWSCVCEQLKDVPLNQQARWMLPCVAYLHGSSCKVAHSTYSTSSATIAQARAFVPSCYQQNMPQMLNKGFVSCHACHAHNFQTLSSVGPAGQSLLAKWNFPASPDCWFSSWSENGLAKAWGIHSRWVVLVLLRPKGENKTCSRTLLGSLVYQHAPPNLHALALLATTLGDTNSALSASQMSKTGKE